MAARAGICATLSLAGRVERPLPHPIPVRVGGFGGVQGLMDHMRDTGITHLIDATHPFAAGMSRNAIAAAAQAQIPLVALTRPAWTPGDGDTWQCVPDMDAAVASLAGAPQKIFLAIGRQSLGKFASAPQHFYLLRLVEAPTSPLPFPDHHVVLDRGPFAYDGDLALLRTHRIGRVIAKNSGGTAARAKLDAARALGLPVTMIDRPQLPPRAEVTSPQAVLDWVRAHESTLRGV